MNRLTIIVLTAGAISVCAGAIVWLKVGSTPIPVATAAARPAPSVDTDRRQRAEKFFGGDPDRNVRRGQKMKPRW